MCGAELRCGFKVNEVLSLTQSGIKRKPHIRVELILMMEERDCKGFSVD